MDELDKLQNMHSQLLKAKYFYYEMHESIMTDYDFDIMEKEYERLARELDIRDNHTLETIVGFDLRPRNLNNFYRRVKKYLIFTSENCSPCNKLKKIFNTKNKYDLELVYYDKNKNFSIFEEYKIKNVPTVIALDEDNNIIKRSVGAYIHSNLKYIPYEID